MNVHSPESMHRHVLQMQTRGHHSLNLQSHCTAGEHDAPPVRERNLSRGLAPVLPSQLRLCGAVASAPRAQTVTAANVGREEILVGC